MILLLIGENTLYLECCILHVAYQKSFDKSYVDLSPWDRAQKLRFLGSWSPTENDHDLWGCDYMHICGSVEVSIQYTGWGNWEFSLFEAYFNRTTELGQG